MTDLDTLAHAATSELLERSTPDVPGLLADLPRIRARRTTAKLVAVAAAVVLGVSSWQLLGAPAREPQPAPAPAPTKVVNVGNGALIGLMSGRWLTLTGESPRSLPRDNATFAYVQFTSDGRSTVYNGRLNRIYQLDVTTGDQRLLATCPASADCLASLSPDGRSLAFSTHRGLELMTVSTGQLEPLDVPGVGTPTRPVWSPDGTSLAFVGGRGLYTVDTDGTDLRLVHAADSPDTLLPSPSWSPDGHRLAFLAGTPIAGSHAGAIDDERFTAMVVSLVDGALTELHDAGHCYCLGYAPPSIAWSPDGHLIAVAPTRGMLGAPSQRAAGVYTIHPDGTGWTLVAGGFVDRLAWQPLIG